MVLICLLFSLIKNINIASLMLNNYEHHLTPIQMLFT